MNDFNIITKGVDHGYKNVKTHNFTFPTKLAQLETLPDDLSGILQVDGKIYTENGEYIPYVNASDKTATKDFYMLNLIALAKELKEQNLNGANINLAVGLPQRWYERQKEDFKEYLTKSKEVHFKYEGKTYHVYFRDCKVFTQGYAALMTSPNIIKYLSGTVIICDIGGGTVDFIPVVNGKVDFANCKIIQQASNWLISNLQEAVETELCEVLPEDYAINYIINGGKNITPQNDYEAVMQKELIKYSEMIFTKFKEFRFNTNITPVVFVGGGSTVIKNFGEYNSNNTEFISNLNANALGYEKIYNLTIG